jgi:hypothetical protein
MKSNILKLSTVLLLLLFNGAGCEKDELPPLEDKQLTIVETNAQGCKDNLKSTDIERYVELKAEEDSKLRIKFTNAMLNCCPGEITSSAFIENEVLKVVFMEETPAQCDCNCDFDLECVIDSMENRSYNIEVYAHSEKPKVQLTFTYSTELNSKISITNN